MFAGWDWATGSHDVTVVDDTGNKVDRWALAHTEAGVEGTLARLRGHGDPAGVPVAIETTRGLVVDRLLAAGHPVMPVHPNAFNAVRPRWGAARAKSDPGDSFKPADYLRTDGHQLRTLAPTLATTLELQALTRQRGDHVEARIATVNQLAALLDEHWPGAKTIFASLDSDIALFFLDRYPTPEAAARLRVAPAAASRLRQATVTRLVSIQLRLVRALRATIREQLAAETGAAPVTKESGKHRAVTFRHATNRRARQALMTFADNSRHANTWAAGIYNDARQRGKRHPHAIRILARAWLRTIWACWRDKACYDPSLHHATNKINKTPGLT